MYPLQIIIKCRRLTKIKAIQMHPKSIRMHPKSIQIIQISMMCLSRKSLQTKKSWEAKNSLMKNCWKILSLRNRKHWKISQMEDLTIIWFKLVNLVSQLWGLEEIKIICQMVHHYLLRINSTKTYLIRANWTSKLICYLLILIIILFRNLINGSDLNLK